MQMFRANKLCNPKPQDNTEAAKLYIGYFVGADCAGGKGGYGRN